MLASFRETTAVPRGAGSALVDPPANGWLRACRLSDILRDTGVCALVNGRQVAVFRVGPRGASPEGEREAFPEGNGDEVYALSNFDPFSKAMVLSRGIVGDRSGVPKVASPIYKQSFDLRTGKCLDDPTVSVQVYPVRLQAGVIEIALAPE